MNITTDLDATKTAGKNTPSKVWSQRINYWVEHHWLLAFNVIWGTIVTLPVLAPALMAVGLTLPARMVYTMYSFLCHQLPERSWFLFGPQISYTQEQIAAAWGVTVASISHEMIRRQFIGAPELGWKIAWSDRMVAMYGSILLFGLLYALLRQWRIRPKGFSWQWLLILILPMALDGATHLVNDVLRLSFRDVNQWAIWLTGGIFPPQFYAGDMFGSLNSLLRITTGLLFGLGLVGFLWPLMDREFSPRH